LVPLLLLTISLKGHTQGSVHPGDRSPEHINANAAALSAYCPVIPAIPVAAHQAAHTRECIVKINI